jgi:thymidylate synthase
MFSVEIVHTEGYFWHRLFDHLQAQGARVTASEVPQHLPLMVDQPRNFLPPETGTADITIAVNIHHDLLVELPYLMAEEGGRALIAPREDPNWIRPGLVAQVRSAADKLGIETAFPQPFCFLRQNTPVISEFCEQYQVGPPRFELTVTDNVVTAVSVIRGAPCGLTHWAVKQFVGVEVGDALLEKAKFLHHGRPCLATMTMLPGMDDTLMHESLFMFLRAVQTAMDAAARKH